MGVNTATITGKNLVGEETKYTFNLLDAKQGLELFHEYSTVVAESFDIIINRASSLEGAQDFVEMIKMVPKILPVEKIYELCKLMVAGAVVEKNGKKITVDETGISDELMGGDPVEFYVSIFYAACANFPKYAAYAIAYLAKDEGDDKKKDSSQSTTTKTAKKSE